MSITISDRAVERIQRIREEQKFPEEAMLRVGVVSGGCSGLTYELDFDTSGGNPGDQVLEDNGIHLIVDMRSFLYLAGTRLDYTEGLDGQGFHFINPNATRTCSCGESFSV